MGTSLEVFFTGKRFTIPNYQRDYAWDVENVDDLMEDIIEAIETKTGHYIGTFILSKIGNTNAYNVVDGQQRLTTLVMLVNAALDQLGTPNDRIIIGDKFIRSQRDNLWRLELMSRNREFFQRLLEGQDPPPQTKSERLLSDAYKRIQARLQELPRSNPEVAQQLLEAIKQLEVMEFVESDDGKAIRMFQTVNDRGKPLSNAEKAKSLLIYYSNRFLDGALDEKINERFGGIFRSFSQIKTIGETYDIETVKQKRFTEDSVMRYHFLAFADDKYDFEASEDYVLNNYLKPTLKSLRGHTAGLRKFITDYVGDLSKFFESLATILGHVPTNPVYYKMFSVLDLSTWLYPLLVRLETKGFLNNMAPVKRGLTLIDLIERADLRVYKVRGTDPKKDMSILARDAKHLDAQDIAAKLLSFIDRFMNDDDFCRALQSEIYPNGALRHIFTEYCQFLRGGAFEIDDLLRQSREIPTIEHIFAQEPPFSFPDYGFSSDADYNDRVDTLGNLTLLEKSLNSRVNNMPPNQKVSPNLYGSSMFEDARRISAGVANAGRVFGKKDLDNRTKTLTEFCMRRWSILGSGQSEGFRS